jgi:sugar diacid utilization regulator
MVDLYLSAATRLWRTVPPQLRRRDRDAVSAAAGAVLAAVDDAVAALIEGHDAERRRLIRQEEATRREFVDDLLRGEADLTRLAERAEPFGLDFATAHQVTLAVPGGELVDARAFAAALERSVADRFGGRDVLVASREGRFVVIGPGHEAPGEDLGDVVRAALGGARKGGRWRLAAGRAHPGAYGIARSYEEAREALRLAGVLRLDADIVRARDLLVYRVLGRDQAAIIDLVEATLAPLARARGGAGPLLDTLRAYFDAGEVATETARRMHLSVRTISYRLARVAELTGSDLADPATRFTLHVAVLGARLLNWPEQDLPAR